MKPIMQHKNIWYFPLNFIGIQNCCGGFNEYVSPAGKLVLSLKLMYGEVRLAILRRPSRNESHDLLLQIHTDIIIIMTAECDELINKTLKSDQ